MVLFPFVSHDQFVIFLSFRIYAAAIIGGAGYVVGALYGVAALLAVPALNDALGLLDNDVFVFGAGLILLTFVAPDGLAGWQHRVGTRSAVADRAARNGTNRLAGNSDGSTEKVQTIPKAIIIMRPAWEEPQSAR